MGPAQSARGIQPGGARRPPGGVRGSSPPGGEPRAPGPGCPPAGRTSPASVRRDRPWVGLERLGAKVARAFGREGARPPPFRGSRALQRSHARTSPLPPGAAGSARCALRSRTGPPAPGAAAHRRGLPSVRSRPRRAARAGDRPTASKGRQGSAAMSAAHPTRLETRTKESNARASRRAFSKPQPGAMKVKVGPAVPSAGRRGGIPAPRGTSPGRTTGPSRPPRRGGGA